MKQIIISVLGILLATFILWTGKHLLQIPKLFKNKSAYKKRLKEALYCENFDVHIFAAITEKRRKRKHLSKIELKYLKLFEKYAL